MCKRRRRRTAANLLKVQHEKSQTHNKKKNNTEGENYSHREFNFSRWVARRVTGRRGFATQTALPKYIHKFVETAKSFKTHAMENGGAIVIKKGLC